MKRIPLLLVALISLLMVVSGSALASARHAAASPTNTSGPTITGTAATGATLSATSGAWNGATPISYAYQWQRCNSSGSSCGTISGATNQNYVVSNSDAGRTIRVQVTATNADGSNQALSGATGTIVNPGAIPANTKQPDPSGKAEDGQKVTVDPGNWSGQKPIAFSYQWQSCNAAGVCTDIAGATSQSFTVTSSQVGSKLRAMITATNSAGKATASSNLTVAVIAKTTGSPVNTTLPLISGSALVGHTVQSSTGVWTGVTTTFGYQWSRCNTNGTSCANISGATGQSYGIGTVDAGNALRVSVTATNSTGSGSATSAASTITATFVLKASFSATLRTGQEVPRPHGTRVRRCGPLHREADRQDAPLDAHVHAPHRQADGRRAEQGPARHERRCVQDALPQLLLTLARHADADRLTARCPRARTDVREHPHDEETASERSAARSTASRNARNPNLMPVRRLASHGHESGATSSALRRPARVLRATVLPWMGPGRFP